MNRAANFFKLHRCGRTPFGRRGPFAQSASRPGEKKIGIGTRGFGFAIEAEPLQRSASRYPADPAPGRVADAKQPIASFVRDSGFAREAEKCRCIAIESGNNWPK